MQPKYIVIAIAALVLAAGAYIVSQDPAALVDGIPTATSTPNATSTQGTTPTKPKEDLSKYPVHDALPQGARAIDDYFYVINSAVFLQSAATTSSAAALQIPDAKASSFKRLTEFTSVNDPKISLDCVKPGNYAFYVDSSSVFFYQLWLNSSFRRSKLERIAGVSPSEFEVLSDRSFRGGDDTYTIGYVIASSTCNYTITAN